MKVSKILGSLVTLFIIGAGLTACGSSNSKTYTTGTTTEGEQPPGNAIIISGNTESSVGVSYTEVGDGSIFVTCGGDGCDVSAGINTSDNTSDINTSGTGTI